MSACETLYQTPSELLRYPVDFARQLRDGEALASVVYEVVEGTAVVGEDEYAPQVDGSQAWGYLSGVVIADGAILLRATATTDASPPLIRSYAWRIVPVEVRPENSGRCC